jgi:hypothetical protein
MMNVLRRKTVTSMFASDGGSNHGGTMATKLAVSRHFHTIRKHRIHPILCGRFETTRFGQTCDERKPAHLLAPCSGRNSRETL